MAGEGVMKIELRDTLSTDIADLPGEIWEDIPGFEDRYQVSNYSRVKSLIKKRPLIISKSISSGKFKVTLVNRFGHISIISCGRLTATVFIRTPKENEVIRYKDNNRLFDIASNLEWITKKESVNSSPNLRTCEKHGMAILKNSDVIEIRRKYHEGVSKRELQQQYKVSLNNIHNIVNRKTWKNI